MEAGIKGKEQLFVIEELSAKEAGSGELMVLGTPFMIALMEKTCLRSVESELKPGQGTVGTSINITHSAPTPLGRWVVCESELIEVDGKRLVFKVSCTDEVGVIGEGIHERFVIDNEAFMSKASQR